MFMFVKKRVKREISLLCLCSNKSYPFNARIMNSKEQVAD